MRVLRLPLVFGRVHADVTLSEAGAVATMTGTWWRAAANQGGDAIGASLRTIHGGAG